MIEEIEELRVESQLKVLGNGKPFRQVKIIPEEAWSAVLIPARVAKLATRGIVAAIAGSGARVDHGHESVGIQPLNRSRLTNAWNVAIAAIRISAGYETRELRAAALDHALAVCRIWCAQHRKWNPAMPEHRAGNLPIVGDVTQRMV